MARAGGGLPVPSPVRLLCGAGHRDALNLPGRAAKQCGGADHPLHHVAETTTALRPPARPAGTAGAVVTGSYPPAETVWTGLSDHPIPVPPGSERILTVPGEIQVWCGDDGIPLHDPAQGDYERATTGVLSATPPIY